MSSNRYVQRNGGISPVNFAKNYARKYQNAFDSGQASSDGGQSSENFSTYSPTVGQGVGVAGTQGSEGVLKDIIGAGASILGGAIKGGAFKGGGSSGAGLSSGFNAGTTSAIPTDAGGWSNSFNTPLRF